MDKARDFRRGGSSRFSATKRQSGIDADGNCRILIKSKKEKLRRLSSVGNEMDHLSLTTSSSKRLKLPKKFFDDDYDPVDHASVPRKLRSAIKKRARESVSPPMPYSRKLGHTVNKVEVEATDCTKKLKSCMRQDSRGSPEEEVVGLITKEEEEVVETLYALAGMLPHNDKVIDKTTETKILVLPGVPKDKDCKLICPPIRTEAAESTSKLEGLPVKMLPNKQLPMELDNSIPRVNLPMISALTKDDSAIERPSCRVMAKLPAWLVNATCATQPCSSETASLTKKDSTVLADRKKSWKTCSAHVYISRLIRILKLAEEKEEMPIQIKPDERSKQEALPATNNLQMMIDGSTEEKSSNEVRNAILLHKRLLQDQPQATTSEMYSSHNQSFDVLSFAGGCCGVEASNIANRSGNRFEPTTRFHNPYLHSPGQNHMIMPQTLPQNRYSTSYADHLSAAAAQQVQMQLPPYYGLPFSGPSHLAASVLPKQQVWAAQFAPPRYCPGEVAAAHVPNWQNRRYDYPASSQTIPPLSSRSSVDVLVGSKCVPSSFLEVFGPKYSQISPKQPITSLLPPKRRESHLLPLGYEENGGLYFPDNASSLQLLCNEHL